MGEVTLLFVIMLVIAAFAFAPLGYFIMKFSQDDGKPFGETEPHGDSESWVLKMAEKAINTVKGAIGKK